MGQATPGSGHSLGKDFTYWWYTWLGLLLPRSHTDPFHPPPG